MRLLRLFIIARTAFSTLLGLVTATPSTTCNGVSLSAGLDSSGHRHTETINNQKKRPSCRRVVFSQKKGKNTIVRPKRPAAFP
jgi:hypothetical protein